MHPDVELEVGGEVSRVQARRAIEALRGGVPNHDAVLALGGGQPRIEARFRRFSSARPTTSLEAPRRPACSSPGDFEAGKSHLLEALEQLALRENFVCSKIVVSKETPLHDPDKLCRAAIQAAVVPASAAAPSPRSPSASTSRARRTTISRPGLASRPAVSARFPASLFIFERTRDEEVRDRIISFWGGDPIDVRLFRGWLRDQGEAATYRLERIGKRDLPLQYFTFTSRLIAAVLRRLGAAGGRGWS